MGYAINGEKAGLEIFHFHSALSVRISDFLSSRQSRPVAGGDVLGFQRQLGAETTLVMINFGKTGLGAKTKNLAPNKAFSLIYPKVALEITSDAKGMAAVTLPAQSVSVFIQK